MANKPTLKKIEQIANNEEAAVALFNDNFNTIEEVIQDSVSRSGKIPTNMLDNLDMGAKRIINLGQAVGDNDAVRYKDVKDALKESQNAKEFAQNAENAAIRADASAALADTSKREAQEAAAGAKTSEDNAQMIYDELIINEAVATVHENIADVKTVAENIEDVNTTADNMEDIEAVVANIGNINTTLDNIADVKTVAENIEDVNTTADNMEDIKAVFDIARRIAYGNIGDIRATFAATAPDGCRFADGSVIRREDYPELFEMLDNGGIPFDSVSIWTINANAHGITGAFGYDRGSSEAYLPLLTEAFVEATNNSPHRVNAASIPDHGHTVKTNVNTETYVVDGLTYNPTEAKAFNASPSHYAASSSRITSAFSTTANYEGGSAVGGVTGVAVSDTVQPKSIMLRHYVVLTNSRQMILTVRTPVATKSALPTTGNINGDIRVVTNEGKAYVWARVGRDSWTWSSIGSVGTGAGGPTEWGYIEGDIMQQVDLKQALDKKITNNATGQGISIGDYSYAGFDYSGTGPNIAIGFDAEASGPVFSDYVRGFNTSIGYGSRTYTTGDHKTQGYNLAIGPTAKTIGSFGSVAIGRQATVEADEAIQLGYGTNSSEGSLQFRDYPLVDANGKIPAERLPDDICNGYKALDEAQKTQLLLDGTYEGDEVVDGEIFTEYDGKFVEFEKTLNPGGSVEALPSSLSGRMFFDPAQGVFMNYERQGTTYYYRLIKSVDGLSWTPVTENYPFYNYVPDLVSAANGKIFNISGGSSLSVSSDGGVTWQSAQGFSFSNNARAGVVAYGNGVYVCKTSNSSTAPIVVSEDGLNWTSYTSPSTSVSSGPVVFNNGVFMYAPSQGSTTIYLSTDGKEWEAVSTPVAFDTGRQSYIASNGYFYTTSRTSPSYSIYRSADGRTWEKVADANTYIDSLVSDGEKVVAYRSSGSATALVIQADGSVITMEGVSNKGAFVYGNRWFTSASSRFTLQPYYEYSLTDLSYNKTEVDAAIADIGGGASSLEDIAVAGEGITFTKLGLVKDYEVVGSPTISADGEVSGFSDSSYLTAINPINAEDSLDSFEIYTAIKKDSVTLGHFGIIDVSGTAGDVSFRLTTAETQNSLRWRASTYGAQSYNIDIVGSTVLEANKKYFVKVTYSSASGYALFSSVDGVEWTPEGTSSVLTRPYKSPVGIIIIGDNAASGLAFDGSLYLGDTYINVNGERAWAAWEEVNKTEVSANVDLTEYLKNTATGGNALAIGGGTAGGVYAIAIGSGSEALAEGATAVGSYAKAKEQSSVAVGYRSVSSSRGVSVGANANAAASYAIQLGRGTNSTANTMSVGLSSSLNVQLLDANGNIPAERLVNAPQPDLSEYTTRSSFTGSNGVSMGFKEVNDYTLVGTLTISDGVVSGYTNPTTNYLQVENRVTQARPSSYEVGCAFTVASLPSSVSTGRILSVSAETSESNASTGIAINDSGILQAVGPASLTGTTVFAAGTKVYAKLTYDSTTGYALYSSTDGVTWNQEASKTSAGFAIGGANMFIGRFAATINPTIYLEECYALVDGVEVWRGYSEKFVAELEAPTQEATTAPTTATVGKLGQVYVDTATGTGYMCVGVDTATPAYTWKQITA